MTAPVEVRDEIDELVDWQLTHPSPTGWAMVMPMFWEVDPEHETAEATWSAKDGWGKEISAESGPPPDYW